MKYRSIVFSQLLVCFGSLTFAQPHQITGIVTDANDQLAMVGVNVVIQGTTTGTVTDLYGKYTIMASSGDVLVFSFVGYTSMKVKVARQEKIDVSLEADISSLHEVIVTGIAVKRVSKSLGYAATTIKRDKRRGRAEEDRFYSMPAPMESQPWNTEGYATIHENQFHTARRTPLSTFSIDVDAASYSNIRRFLVNGQQPPKDAVRIEEMVNYFDYDYKPPTGDVPFSVYTEVSVAPWNKAHRLVHIGIQGKEIPTESLPASNLVFLIDVSGSMSSANKLPLLKKSLAMLVDQLREQDQVAIVVYAGAAGVVLQPTSGADKTTIRTSLDRLTSGGSTAGGAGIKLAYSLARSHFIEGGNNRVILATDGDFNIGASSDAAMERLIEKERESGIFITVLGFGMGNYKDSKMETLADQGNGNYAYIDNILEARKVLVTEFGGTLFTIAKDVKIQVEFNPATVKEYRLIGYENRKLQDEDFNNDKKDAGELGAGHTVTALYELIPAGSESLKAGAIDPLKYQQPRINKLARSSHELMTVKLRYKKPDGLISQLITVPVVDEYIDLEATSDNFRWSAAVAEFGMLLRDSKFKSGASYMEVNSLARSALGNNPKGYRQEFL